MTPSATRLDAVDGLRGLAALAVALLHFQNLFGLDDYPLHWGALPVDLFFILSGFILSRKYLLGLTSRAISATTFLIHRISRLWPLHIFALLLLLAEEHIANVYGLTNFHVLGPADTPWAVLLNVLLLHSSGLYSFPTLDLPSWSISSELLFNVAWMLLVLRGWWNWRIALATAALGTVYVYSLGDTFNICGPCNGYPGVNNGIVKTALGFSIGCLLFWIHDAGFRFRRPNLVGTTAGVVLVAILTFYSQIVHYYCDFLVVLVVFPLLTLAAVDETTSVSRVLSSFPLRWLGRISFSIYLLQFPVSSALSYLLLVGMYPSPPWIGFVFVAVLLSASYLTYATVERGGIHLIRGFTRFVVRHVTRAPADELTRTPQLTSG